jgi:hypothetical protein
MSGIFDKLNNELESFGKKAQQAIDGGRLHLEKFRLQRERDEAARRLGYLVHRRDRGQQVEATEIESWMGRIDEHDAAIAKLEREIASVKAESVSVSTAPPPAGATTGEAEVVKEAAPQ